MKNKISFKQKLDLLIISLEALEIFYVNNLVCEIKSIYNVHNNPQQSDITNLIKSYTCFRGCYNDIYDYFINIILYVYGLHKTLNIYLLSKTANIILNYYINYKKSYNLRQYLRKFNHIYFRKNRYYQNYKYINYWYDINITKLAVINLYLITKLSSKKGIYILVKYLYS
uniref:Uncharacterized protein n=1 Tax=Laurencieae sp. TaxID=2007162 RepID=A0A1Z1M2K3_9FLOR|nr:hypothetical protein [Laurencieae sp.]